MPIDEQGDERKPMFHAWFLKETMRETSVFFSPCCVTSSIPSGVSGLLVEILELLRAVARRVEGVKF